jgi:hypothetical protein
MRCVAGAESVGQELMNCHELGLTSMALEVLCEMEGATCAGLVVPVVGGRSKDKVCLCLILRGIYLTNGIVLAVLNHSVSGAVAVHLEWLLTVLYVSHAMEGGACDGRLVVPVVVDHRDDEVRPVLLGRLLSVGLIGLVP